MRPELNELLLRLTQTHKSVPNGMAKSELEVAIDTVTKMIDSLRVVDTGWTATTDGLPKQSGWYWTWTPSEGVSEQWYRATERTFENERTAYWMVMKRPDAPEGWA